MIERQLLQSDVNQLRIIEYGFVITVINSIGVDNRSVVNNERTSMFSA